MSEVIAMLAAVVLIKITAMIVGYKIVKLGYDALLKGIKGDFDFGGKLSGKAELRLLSASPGLFFVLFGALVIIWAIVVEKPVTFSRETITTPTATTTIMPETMDQKK